MPNWKDIVNEVKELGGTYVKRQYFDISLDGAVVATTFAWNSAIRTIERLVRERSVAVGGVYKLVDSLSDGPDK